MSQIKQKTTGKRMIIHGEERWRTPNGMYENLQHFTIEDSDCNFHKVWLLPLLFTYDNLGSKKIMLANWIITHLNRDNQLLLTYRQIAKESGFSINTVARTVQILLEVGFLKRMNLGNYMVNPDIIFKGAHRDRMNLLITYQNGEQQTLFDEVPPEAQEPKKAV